MSCGFVVMQGVKAKVRKGFKACRSEEDGLTPHTLSQLQRQRLPCYLRRRKSPVAEPEPFPVFESRNDLIYCVAFDIVGAETGWHSERFKEFNRKIDCFQGTFIIGSFRYFPYPFAILHQLCFLFLE